MPEGQLIEFDRVTKRFGAVAAVSDLSARIGPGVVTGFLGPNGAGKTTSLRMLVGLERPTSGTATIGGSRYSELRNPARVVGAMLEDPGFRPRRTVERHLIAAAKAGGIPQARVGEMLAFVGLDADGDTRISALSLGMRQRLSAAVALLGDPGVLILDEPANGLDPEGIRWMRTLMRGLADEGRTVLVSSHVLSEVEQIADEVIVIARGHLKFAGTMEDLADPRGGPVIVDAPDRATLSTALKSAGYDYEILRSGLTIRGSDAATIGAITARAGVALTTLQQRGPTLEDVFLDLVNDRYVRPEPVAVTTTALSTIAVTELEAELGADEAETEAGPDAGADATAEAGPTAATGPEVEPAPAGDVEGEPAAEAGVEGAPDAHSAGESLDDSETESTAAIQTESAPANASSDASELRTEHAHDSVLTEAEIAFGFESRATAEAEQVAATAPDASESDDDSAADDDDSSADGAPVDRPLPGLEGLAAIASSFNAPAVALADAADGEASADGDEGDEEHFDAQSGDPASGDTER